MEPTQGPTAGELTQSRSNMLVSALVSAWLNVACIGSGIASNIVSLSYASGQVSIIDGHF